MHAYKRTGAYTMHMYITKQIAQLVQNEMQVF